MDWLSITIKVLSIDVSALFSKLFYQYLNMHRQSAETRRKTKEIAAIEAEHIKALADKEIEYKRESLAIKQAEKEREIKIRYSQELQSFLTANGFKTDPFSANEGYNNYLVRLERIYKRKKEDPYATEPEPNLESRLHSLGFFFESYGEGTKIYTFYFCKKCGNLVDTGMGDQYRRLRDREINDCEFCGGP